MFKIKNKDDMLLIDDLVGNNKMANFMDNLRFLTKRGFKLCEIISDETSKDERRTFMFT